ncbi:hypothetical protein X805_38040 [Sphaerotilus natans subsp. natans DSM 6575]|uniref:Uncharacterized protein n=1 Tax=Sphaerotilus natans subsp. natans DSM 6575 TaxID=1286631 RepID=A0A059KGM9_9BURK|nr:hypothetical protein [Sphaerotilus natans]KDB50596.1 hypothetical protein X805_38040 [Sphaerotilus natans subsp. natans DSM 6575]SIR52718.1 hypothetical protein SAMN05421778_111129 [Sphaerotilus natans]
MAIVGGASYPQALALPMSSLSDFFDSRAYSDFLRRKEAEGKVTMAMIDRGDAIIRAVGGLARVMSKSMGALGTLLLKRSR